MAIPGNLQTPHGGVQSKNTVYENTIEYLQFQVNPPTWKKVVYINLYGHIMFDIVDTRFGS